MSNTATDSLQEELESLQKDLAAILQQFLISQSSSVTSASSEMAAEHFMLRFQAIINKSNRESQLNELGKVCNILQSFIDGTSSFPAADTMLELHYRIAELKKGSVEGES